jgi:cytochrome c-type biogenesis protein
VNGAALAFAAGLFSFATPCVLPLVPAYVSAIGARGERGLGAVRAGLLFVAGFSSIFVLLGVAAGAFGGRLADHRLALVQLAGIVIVAMGLVVLGILPVPALGRTLAPGLDRARATGSPLLLGGAFGLCWTPCVGPVLASILALAASGATAARGAALLAAYAAGLALPFLVAAVALGRAMQLFRPLRDRYAQLRIASGAVLVAAGLLVFFDRMYVVNTWVGRAI